MKYTHTYTHSHIQKDNSKPSALEAEVSKEGERQKWNDKELNDGLLCIVMEYIKVCVCLCMMNVMEYIKSFMYMCKCV